MSFMGRIAKLDSAMQRGLDNSFAYVFGGRVVPAEIEELLKQEAEDNVVQTYEGTTEAPNLFHVRVSSKDFELLSNEYPQLGEKFSDQLTRFFRNKGWANQAPVVVTIECDEGLRTGQLRAASQVELNPKVVSGFVGIKPPPATQAPNESEPAVSNSQSVTNLWEEPEAPAPQYLPPQSPPKSQPVVSLLLQDGSSRTYHVVEGSNIIGRGNNADFRLPDTGVSRQHAEIIWNGADAILVDLQSTNGTTVNDNPIENWLLADGDVITVGHSHIEVRIII
jgi:hypothetical protein